MKKLLTIAAIGLFMILANDAQSQLLDTKLQVTVRNDLGNIVEGATVTLYKTMTDYENEENAVQSGTTDEKGRVKFTELASMAYFMHVKKGDLTNIGRGVQTSKLISKKKNMLNVIIE
ncbi:MAG: Ig-like domain-containing protein [Cyclobacteriaceae bacterium]